VFFASAISEVIFNESIPMHKEEQYIHGLPPRGIHANKTLRRLMMKYLTAEALLEYGPGYRSATSAVASQPRVSFGHLAY
jgi:hypothetical protein